MYWIQILTLNRISINFRPNFMTSNISFSWLIQILYQIQSLIKSLLIPLVNPLLSWLNRFCRNQFCFIITIKWSPHPTKQYFVFLFNGLMLFFHLFGFCTCLESSIKRKTYLKESIYEKKRLDYILKIFSSINILWSNNKITFNLKDAYNF